MPTAPHKQQIAQEFIENEQYKKNIVFHKGYELFYLWNDGYYKLWKPDDMHEEVTRYIMTSYPKVGLSQAYIKDVIYFCQLLCLRKVDHEEYNYIALQNYLLNLTTFGIEPFDRNKVVLYSLPCKYSEMQMETPVFHKYLRTTFVDPSDHSKTDEEMIQLVQEMLGFFLLDSNRAHAAFFLVGDGSNGKSKITTLLENIFGKEFCSFNTIETLTTNNWAVLDLIGKKINISSEDESKFVQTSMFKALVGGDTISGERKYVANRVTFTPRTKFIFSTNDMPTFKGLNYALKRRVKIIPFYNRFEGNARDFNLDDKFKTEIPGIIAWAVRGAKRLIENDFKFTEPVESKRMMQEFEEGISSALRFVNEKYIVDNEEFVSNDDIYYEYTEWCRKYGMKPVNVNNFGKDILNNLRGAKSIRRTIGTQMHWGKNMRHIEPGDLEDYPEEIKVDDIKF